MCAKLAGARQLISRPPEGNMSIFLWKNGPPNRTIVVDGYPTCLGIVMQPSRRALLALILTPLVSGTGMAGTSALKPPPKTLPMTQLAPAKLIPNLCLFKYRVSTSSAKCQVFVDQGL